RGFDDRHPHYVEGGIENDGDPSLLVELHDQVKERTIRLLAGGLDPPRPVDVNHCRHQGFLVLLELTHPEPELAVWSDAIQFKPILRLIEQNDRSEGTESFSMFHTPVQHFLSIGTPGIANDAALAQCSRPQF